MKFQHQILHGLEDAEQNFEQLQTLFAHPGAQLPFVQLLSAESLRLAQVAVTLTWAAGQASNVVTFTHGIGSVPVAGVANAYNLIGSGRTDAPSVGFGNWTSSQGQVQGWMPGGVWTGTLTITIVVFG